MAAAGLPAGRQDGARRPAPAAASARRARVACAQAGGRARRAASARSRADLDAVAGRRRAAAGRGRRRRRRRDLHRVDVARGRSSAARARRARHQRRRQPARAVRRRGARRPSTGSSRSTCARAFFVAQAAAGRMRAAARRLTSSFVSSQMGHVGAALTARVYCATQARDRGADEGAGASSSRREGIRVVSVAPTFVRTEMTAAQLDDPGVGRAAARADPARALRHGRGGRGRGRLAGLAGRRRS